MDIGVDMALIFDGLLLANKRQNNNFMTVASFYNAGYQYLMPLASSTALLEKYLRSVISIYIVYTTFVFGCISGRWIMYMGLVYID